MTRGPDESFAAEWRPFEAAKEEMLRVAADKEANRCNLHTDCAAADAKVVAQGGRITKHGDFVQTAFHCSISDCEDCFGC